MPKSALDRYGRNTLGWPDNSQFVMPAREMDQLLTKAGGDVAVVEKALGIPPGQWADQALDRIDVPKPSDLNLRMPYSNQMGANQHWLPGGRLPTGYREAVINQIPKAAYVERGVMGRAENARSHTGIEDKAVAAQKLAAALRYRALGWNHEQGRLSVIETMAISRAEKTFGKTIQASTIEGVDINDPNGWGNVSLKGPFLNRDLRPLTDAQQMKAVSNVTKHIQQNSAVDTHVIDATGMLKAAEETLRQAVKHANQRIIFMRGD